MTLTTIDDALRHIESLGHTMSVSMVDRLHEMPREPGRRFLAIVTRGPGWQFCQVGPTRLDALRGAIEQMERAAEEEIARREQKPASLTDDRQIALL